MRPHEEVTGLPRKHDRVVRCVHSLIAELDRRVPKPLPCIAKFLGQVFRQCLFRGRPAIVLNALGNPLLAVVTLVTLHASILSRGASAPLQRFHGIHPTGAHGGYPDGCQCHQHQGERHRCEHSRIALAGLEQEVRHETRQSQ